MGSSSHTARPQVSVLAALWAVILVPAIFGLHATANAAPLETYGRLPSLEDIALAPSGKRIAFVRTNENRALLVIADFPNTLSPIKHIDRVTLKEDHWLSRSETRLLMLQSSIAFLKANNPPD